MSWHAALFTCQSEKLYQVYQPLHINEINARCNLYPVPITPENIEAALPALKDLQVIFTTWGMFPLTETQLDMLPALKVVFYAAGATDYFSAPLLARKIKVVSAWQANAIPVAEFCLAQILLGCKGYFRNQREYTDPSLFSSLANHHPAPGNYQERVALIGAGAISQALQRLLQPFYLDVIVIPSREEKRTLSLEQAFASAYVISNHLPDRPDNIGILNGNLFRRMRSGAVFINTGRGRQVNEEELIEVLLERPDLTALLDVTKPEPPAAESLLYTLPNVQLTSHIAGALNNETRRLANCVLDEFQRWLSGKPLLYDISARM
ncbi:MAG: NAD(P)-dependent oxidoreductase [Klebsiella michiganensis]|uniref:Phosphoglycerate dehydrogenase n=1 Tax=Superficieibacter electus TaxID=2022662 RepID=A0A2P5GLM4_9ENTR|nr:NAD(P)-dependent oxidoreductase [Superficieibacter electus]MDU4390405.1 NAD(P)-dependent oxidoreductase [Klebsiella michiganensis]MDU4436076.1 NAD(P)-dependent oxidoreductase [Pluralibacter gergoviae]POP43799.1 phosphoglycerate dehydrogenase [Superficieibacter electus]POP46147.1 phosphoglycerate dehydrogenase [Superficieibacter electus]